MDSNGLTVKVDAKGTVGILKYPKLGFEPMALKKYETTFDAFASPSRRNVKTKIEVGTFCWKVTQSYSSYWHEADTHVFLTQPFPIAQRKKRKRRKTILPGQQTIGQFFRPAKKARRSSDSGSDNL
jgi:hypothetical protein